MTGGLPSRPISGDALERIIQRAAELQAAEMDVEGGLTEQELLKLGAEVGIEGRFLRQALYEETAGGGATVERGLLARWAGPAVVRASRVVPGDRATLDQALAGWMTESEALAIKRRLPDRTVWERQKGFFAEMKRGLGVGGRSYELAEAKDVSVVVTLLEEGYCHTEMLADISNRRGARLGGTLGCVIAGGAYALFAAIFGVSLVVPIGVGAALTGLGALWLGYHRETVERTQLALEQVLDRLERGEIRPKHRLTGPRASAFMRIASEIKRAISEVAETSGQPPRGLPPSSS